MYLLQELDTVMERHSNKEKIYICIHLCVACLFIIESVAWDILFFSYYTCTHRIHYIYMFVPVPTHCCRQSLPAHSDLVVINLKPQYSIELEHLPTLATPSGGIRKHAWLIIFRRTGAHHCKWQMWSSPPLRLSLPSWVTLYVFWLCFQYCLLIYSFTQFFAIEIYIYVWWVTLVLVETIKWESSLDTECLLLTVASWNYVIWQMASNWMLLDYGWICVCDSNLFNQGQLVRENCV